MNTILSPLNVRNDSTGVYFTDQLLVALLPQINLLLKGSIGCGKLAKHVSNQTRTETNQDTSALHSLECNLVTDIILTNKSPELINNPATIGVNWYSKATKDN